MTPIRQNWPWAWTASVLVVNVAVIVATGSSDAGFSGADEAVFSLLPTWFVALGAMVATRAAGNRVAWILMWVGTGLVAEGAAELKVGPHPPPDPSAWDVAAVIWLNSGFFFALVIPLALLLYLFPTGRFLSRRWEWAGWTALALSFLALGAEAFTSRIGPDDGAGNTAWTIVNPIGVFEYEGLENSGFVAPAFGLGLVALLVCSIPAVISRYRRGSLDDRSQLKWVGIALVMLMGTILVRLLANTRGEVAGVLFALAIASVPLSVTVAIMRYRLYDIDRLISRVLTYAVVVALLGSVYVGVVALVTSFMPAQDSTAVAASTLAVAALFNPLRSRVRRFVDRRFHRSAYEAELLAARMGEHLGQSVSMEAIVGTWTATVTDALRPASTSVWIRSSKPSQSASGSRSD